MIHGNGNQMAQSHTRLARVITLGNLLVYIQSLLTQTEDLEATMQSVVVGEFDSALWHQSILISRSHLANCQRLVKNRYDDALAELKDHLNEAERNQKAE